MSKRSSPSPAGAGAESADAGGLRTFAVLWFGQLVSLVGSDMSRFALGVWVYQETGSATRFTLILLAGSLPVVALSPIAGPLVDRWDRRRTMIVSDCVAAVPTVALALLLLRRDLELWHIYLAVALGAAAGAFQWPAYAASTTLLVPQRQLACAAGMVELARAGSTILAPLLAGALLLRLELWHLLLLDTATFLVAVALLQTVRIPRPAPSAAGQARGTLWQESLLGWRYLAARPGLFYLLGYFSFLNFSVALVLGLTTPMMLAFTTADVLGATLSAGALGMFLGGLTLTAWGGPRRKAAGALGFGFLLGAGLILAGARPSPGLITAGLFAFYFAIPIINGCSQAIWQTKTPPDLQGRVFAIRRMCATFTAPLAYLVAGPLADRVFEPVLAAGGLLTGSLGQLTGVGPGRGIGAMLVFQGALSLLVAALGLRTPRLVRVEEELPDALGRPAAER